MKRFDTVLKQDNDTTEYVLPSKKVCKIVLRGKHGGKTFSGVIYDVSIEGQYIATISRRWNWDNFVSEFLSRKEWTQ